LKNRPERDLRKYSRSTLIRLILGGLFFLFVVGEILIFIFYGKSAALTGLLCFIGGLSPVILVLLALWIIDLISKKNK
jgi:hypothetical protein